MSASENIRPGFNPPSPAKDPQGITRGFQFTRQQYITQLDNMYEKIERVNSPFLDPSEYMSFQIYCRPLNIMADGSHAPEIRPCFFRSLSLQTLLNHPVDYDYDEQVRKEVGAQADMITEFPEKRTCSMDSAIALTYRMEWEFCECPRKNLPQEGDAIMALTPWIPGGCEKTVFYPYFRSSLLKGKHCIPWMAWTVSSQVNHPHTMLILQHGIEGEERLTRGEVLSVLAAIITRMELPDLSEHLIIPVLVVSFMGKQHGRIIQAFYNQTGLNIWMSKLFDFTTPETAEPNFQIFLQQMASRPVGESAHQPLMSMGLSLRQK